MMEQEAREAIPAEMFFGSSFSAGQYLKGHCKDQSMNWKNAYIEFVCLLI